MKSKVLFHVMFCLLIVSFVWAEDPDYGDIPENAETVLTDGTIVQGSLENGDVDWFKFTPVANTLYRVTLNGQLNAGYKTMQIYQIDEFDNLNLTINFSVWSNEVSARTFFIEEADDVYIQMSNNPGGYSFYIENLGYYPPDTYSDDCASATEIIVDAAPISGTLTHNPDGSLEVDWFVFDTQPLHMYEIRLTKSDNTDLNFQIFNENCEYLLYWAKNYTVTSWFGEQYRIYVAGSPAHLGTYYTLEVVDLGLYPDDYSNVFETADPVTADGSIIEGEIDFNSNYRSDEDWFVFTPVANTLYRVTLNGQLNAGYKTMQIYQIDEFDNLNLTINFSVWSNEVSARTFFIEEADDVYIQMSNNPGGYSFYIENLGYYPPDTYSDDCASATEIIVDAAPISGTLTHNPDGSLEVDWFVFDTQPLHMYEIRLTKSDNTDLNFQIFNENCEYLLYWAKNYTVTSWFGEQYRIYVAGSPAHLGTYYTLEVVDLGLYPDDYPNIADNAVNMPKDGTLIEGEIQFLSSYHSDEDWLTFIAGQDGDYQFTLAGEVDKGYKTVNVYWEDELGVLRHQKNVSVWSDGVSNFTVTLPAGNIYVQMSNNLGGYKISVVSPEPRCGDLDHPYPPGDVSEDCVVNLVDFAMMADNWLVDVRP